MLSVHEAVAESLCSSARALLRKVRYVLGAGLYSYDKILSLCHGSKGPWLEASFPKFLSQVSHDHVAFPGQCSRDTFKSR